MRSSSFLRFWVLGHFVYWFLLGVLYYFMGGAYFTGLGIPFLFFNLIGQWALFALLFGLTASLLVLLPWKKAAYITVGILGFSLNLILTIDLMVFAQYRMHINMAVLELLFGPARSSIFALSAINYLFFGLGFVILGLISWAIFFLARRLAAKISVGLPWLCGVALFFIVGQNFLSAYGTFMGHNAILAQKENLPFPYSLRMNRFLTRTVGLKRPENAINPQLLDTNGVFNYPLKPLTCIARPGQEPPNILFLLVDSLRADAFNAAAMPHSYAFFQKYHAFNFTSHFSGGNATSTGIFSWFYGLPGSYWNAATSSAIPPVMIQKMQEANYQLGIFGSAPLNSPAFNLNVFVSVKNLRVASKLKSSFPADTDQDALDDFLIFMEQRDKTRPFMGMIFLDAPHAYAYPANFQERFTPSSPIVYALLNQHTDPTPYRNRYLNAVAYTDELFASVYTLLEREQLLDNTIVMLSGDHAQEFNDSGHNFWGHNGNFTRYQTQVPLAVLWPSQEGHSITHLTSHYDIAPTILQEVFNCQNQATDFSVGQNLLRSAGPPPYIIQANYNHKVIRSLSGAITDISNFGRLHTYNDQYEDVPADSTVIRLGLQDFARFLK